MSELEPRGAAVHVAEATSAMQYELTPVAQPSAAAESSGATPWLAPVLKVFPIGSRRCVVRNPLNGAALEISSGEYAVLSACEGWCTLAGHAEQAATKLGAPPEHRSAMNELLQRCAQAGLLVSLPDLVQRFGLPPAEPRTALAGVVIRTADRPELLARLLASAKALEARTGSRRRWIVVDDSHDPENEQANRAAIDASPALEIEHIDRNEADRLKDELRNEFPAFSRELEWLLGAGLQGEMTAGRPFNLALLRLAGRAFVSIDDDALVEARRPAMCEAGFAVSDEPDELLWYETEEALWNACRPVALDPIDTHEQWLGLPLAEAWMCAEHQAGTLSVIRMAAAQSERFGAGARVLFTHNHACGDPGSSVLPLQLLTLPESSCLWLAANPQVAAYAFGPRINWRGQARLRLAPQRLLTFTTMAGIDNSRLLPPTARGDRSQDILFGLAAQMMYPTSWAVDLPFALPHLRAPRKRWLGSTDPFMQEPLHVACSQIEAHGPRIAAESAAERLAAMGAQLLDLAGASDQSLREMLLQHAAETGSRTLFAIQTQLDSATLPAAWKAALAPWLRSPALALDADALRKRVLEPARVRMLFLAYGRAMRAWPQLWEFCRQKPR